MWQVLEHRRVDRQLTKAPREILKRYEKWKDVAGFYQVISNDFAFCVESITPHDYRRR